MVMNERHGGDFFEQEAPEKLNSLFDSLLLFDQESLNYADCLREIGDEALASDSLSRGQVESMKKASEELIRATTTAIIFGFGQDDATFDDKMRLAHELVESDEILRTDIYAEILNIAIGDEPLETDFNEFSEYHTLGIDDPETIDATEAIVGSILSDHEAHMRSDLNVFIGKLLFDDIE